MAGAEGCGGQGRGRTGDLGEFQMGAPIFPNEERKMACNC